MSLLPHRLGTSSSGHLQALAHLASPARVRESLALAPRPPLRNAALIGLQVALATFIAVALAQSSPWAEFKGYAALGALAALFGRSAPIGQRSHILVRAGLLLVASTGLPSLIALAGASPAQLLLCLALVCGLLTAGVHRWQLGGPGAVIFVFAASAALSPPSHWLDVALRTSFTLFGACVAWWLCRVSDPLRATTPMPATSAPPELPENWLVMAARITLCAFCAAWLAQSMGWAFPSWAAIGATAVLQGRQLHVVMHRVLQRMAGTILGAGIAGLLLATHPSLWLLLFLVVTLQFTTELAMGFNYGLGQIALTPMALLMSSLAAPATASAMPLARVLDTALGALIGLMFAWVFSSLEARRDLAMHHIGARAIG